MHGAVGSLHAVLASLAVGTKRFDITALALGDEYRFAVGAAEGEVGGLLALQRDFTLDLAVWSHDGNRSFEDSRDQQPPGDVGAQAVDRIGFERLQKPRIGKRRSVDRIGPYLSGAGFPDIQRPSVGT